MIALNPAQLVLQARIAVMRLRTISCIVTLLFICGGAAWIWLALPARAQDDQQERALVQARQALRAAPVLSTVTQGSKAEKNLRDFYGALGKPSDAELHLKTLFAIAEETGLQLDQGEYKLQLDKNSMTYRYQILLPLKGPYGAIRQFCEKTLLTMPFISLDELSFKRESIAEDALDAKLHFTLYLRDAPRAGLQAGTRQP